jgi:hypothetical protein
MLCIDTESRQAACTISCVPVVAMTGSRTCLPRLSLFCTTGDALLREAADALRDKQGMSMGLLLSTVPWHAPGFVTPH